MEDIQFSDEFCRFLQAIVPAVDAAELLLLLHRRPDDAFSPEEAAKALGPGITAADARKYLEVFKARGLAAPLGERFQYSGAAPELRAHLETLAKAYTQRPVTLIRVIYALRDSSIKSFAEAFRLRKN